MGCQWPAEMTSSCCRNLPRSAAVSAPLTLETLTESKQVTIFHQVKLSTSYALGKQFSNTTKNIYVVNTQMNPRIRLLGKNNTPTLSSLNRLNRAKDPGENVRATPLLAIKILSMAPMITIEDDSWRVNKRSRSRNLNIKMRDRLPTSICPDVRSNKDIINPILGIILIPKRMPRGMGRKRVGSQSFFKVVTNKIAGRNGPGRTRRPRCQPRKPTMPEEATRPIGAVPVHQRKELRIVTKFHKRGIPKRDGHHGQVHCKTYR